MSAVMVACGSALIAAFTSIISLFLNRKWQKEDKTADGFVMLSNKIDNLASELKSHIDSNEMSDAKAARVRILRFADECRREEKHSKEFFDSVLDDIDTYEHYCKEHPKFENNKTVASAKLVKELYNSCLLDNKFI